MWVETENNTAPAAPEALKWKVTLMKVIIAKDYQQMSEIAAKVVEDVVLAKPDARLGFATGSSPVGLYQCLARDCAAGKVDFSKVDTVNLDEYAGLEPDHPQSYRRFMNENLFDHINVDKKNTYVAKGTGDYDENVREFRAVLARKPIDIQVLGIGVDGHIGFNEPGRVLCDHAHMETLDESTIDANARFFQHRDEVPRHAFTMGIGDILRAKKLVMVIPGANKAAVAKGLLMSEELDCGNPATMVKLHPDVTVVIEREVADAIGYRAE